MHLLLLAILSLAHARTDGLGAVGFLKSVSGSWTEGDGGLTIRVDDSDNVEITGEIDSGIFDYTYSVKDGQLIGGPAWGRSPQKAPIQVFKLSADTLEICGAAFSGAEYFRFELSQDILKFKAWEGRSCSNPAVPAATSSFVGRRLPAK